MENNLNLDENIIEEIISMTLEDCSNLYDIYNRLNKDLKIKILIEDSIILFKELLIKTNYDLFYDYDIFKIPFLINDENDFKKLLWFKGNKKKLNLADCIYNIYFNNDLIFDNYNSDDFLVDIFSYNNFGFILISLKSYKVNSPIFDVLKYLKDVYNKIFHLKLQLDKESKEQVNLNIEYHKHKHNLNSIKNKITNLKAKSLALEDKIIKLEHEIASNYYKNNINKIDCDIDSVYSKDINESILRVKCNFMENKLKNKLKSNVYESSNLNGNLNQLGMEIISI